MRRAHAGMCSAQHVMGVLGFASSLDGVLAHHEVGAMSAPMVVQFDLEGTPDNSTPMVFEPSLDQ